MRATLILIFSIILSAVVLILLAGFVLAPRNILSPASSVPSAAENRLTIKSISFDYPSGFALATRSNQLLESWGVPVCNLGFDYCLYDLGAETGTSTSQKLGLRVNVTQTQSEDECVNPAPLKDNIQGPEVSRMSGYSTFFFGPLELNSGDNYSYGYIYRIFVDNTCYELETRIILSGITKSAKSQLSKLNPVIESVSLVKGGERVFLNR